MIIPSGEALDRKEERAEAQAAQIEKHRAFVETFSRTFWNAFSMVVQTRIDSLQRKRDAECPTLSEADTKMLWARQDELRKLLEMPQDIMGSHEALKRQHEKLKQEIKQYRERLGKT